MLLPVVGVASENSQVVEGVACRLRHDMLHIVQANTDTTLRTVVCKNYSYVIMYSGTSLIRTSLRQKKVSLLVRCPDFRGCNVHKQDV